MSRIKDYPRVTDELERIKIQADIEYIAMMTDIEL